MNNFSFWKLYKKQWSWKNEYKSFMLVYLFSLCYTVGFMIGYQEHIAFFDGLVLWLSHMVTVIVWYQTIKVIVFGFACYGIVYFSNKGEQEAIDWYNKMMVRRKQ